MKISLVIPIKDEENSLEPLYQSICEQTCQPHEVVLVDGGSTDNTVSIAKKLKGGTFKLKLIKIPQASPGKGRNIGVENTENEWIAFTDAGINLKKDWLENLIESTEESPTASICYGNYSPITDSFFEKCAAISYVPPLRENKIRGKFIASCLLKKEVWNEVGGFPDLRAAEDLMFMEAAESSGFKFVYAPEAVVYWHLRPNLTSTFRKFVVYSKYNIWAGRQWDWHYGILKQYVVLLPFLLLSVFHSLWWLTAIVLWLFARTLKRILAHRYEFGWRIVFNPFIFFGVMFLTLVIDMATFIGWGQAIFTNQNK